MTEIRFYHLTRSAIEQALPELLEKTLARGLRAVVRVAGEARVEELTSQLWSYRQEAFLPHGTTKDGQPADQPIWITSEQDRPNGAQVLFLINGAGNESLDGYDLLCEVFDGNNDDVVTLARQRWSLYKKEGHDLAYWQQTDRGWTKTV